MKQKSVLIMLLFFFISVFVLSEIIFNEQLIGRFLDFTVPPVSFLMENAFAIDFYQWWGTVNGGGRNTFSAALVPVNSILYLPTLFDASPWFIARYQLVLTLFLGMLFFYILSGQLLKKYRLGEKNKTVISIIGALFFTLNNYFFCELIFGSNVMYLTFAFVPLLIYSLVSYFKTEKKKFFFLSLFSLVIISSTLQHLILAYAIILAFSFIYERKITFVKLGFLHFLLSQYWVLPLLFTSAEIGSSELAVDYTASLNNNTTEFISALVNKEYFGNRNLYNLALSNSKLSILWMFNSFLVLGVSFLALFKLKFFEKSHRKIILFASLFFIGSILFIKGGREPFGAVIVYLYQNIPLFNVFRSLQRYTSFYVVGISLLFVFSSIFLVSKSKKFLPLLFIVVLVNALPWWWTRDLGTENIIQANTMPSYFGQFYLNRGNWKMYSINNLQLDFSLISIPPGSSIYFLAVDDKDSNYIEINRIKIKSQGADVGLAYGNKGFYATEIEHPFLETTLNNLEKEMYTNGDFLDENKNLFSLLNIKYFVLREDTAPLFSKNSPAFNLENVKKAIENAKIIKSSEKTDYVTILENKNFLPKIYIPKTNILTWYAQDKIGEILSDPDYKIRSAIFFKKQNLKKQDENSDDLVVKDAINQIEERVEGEQVLEFRKINPTKYRVRIHGAGGRFPLVFSESFHDGWKTYLAKSEQDTRYKIQDTNRDGYKILDGNEGDQASGEDLEEYIEKGWVTDLGNMKEKEIEHKKWDSDRQKEQADYTEKYSIDFISKNFQGTIQNDNLPSGHFWETWFQEPIENNANHLTANGYANSWVIDADKICGLDSRLRGNDKEGSGNDNAMCIQNPDGTHDLELVVEFWPQRLFYIGLIISGATLLTCLSYLGYEFIKRRKKEI